MGQKNTRKRTNGVKPIKTLWFDLGNVILPFDFNPAFKRLGRIGKTDPQAIRRFFHKRPWLEADCDEGRIHGLGLYRLLRKSFNLNALPYGQFKHIWNDIFEENHEVSSIIRNLKRGGYRLVLISNTNKLHFDYLRVSYPIINAFHRHILSFRIKRRKPHRKIYQIALKTSYAKPEEIFYTDDREELTQAASENHGVHSHTFRSAKGLKKALLSRGVRI